MRKLLLFVLITVLIATVAGCSSVEGIPQEQYDELLGQYESVQTQLAEAVERAEAAEGALEDIETSVVTEIVPDEATLTLAKQLSVISSYMLWYDNYYGTLMLEQSDDLFIQRLGTLIAATDNEEIQAAFYAFYEADAAYRLVVAGLPQDNTVWTQAQYDEWIAAGTARSEALGQVGGYIYPVLQEIEWFSAQ